jgi:thioredoxin-like negative regulator of GroEL
VEGQDRHEAVLKFVRFAEHRLLTGRALASFPQVHVDHLADFLHSVTRGAAAEALAKLNAVEALPQITKALERLEKAKDPDGEMEKIRLEMAKANLEAQAKKKEGRN